MALRSARPVEVTLDLREESPDAALAVQQLHALGGDGVHRISGVSFDRPDGRLRLHLPHLHLLAAGLSVSEQLEVSPSGAEQGGPRLALVLLSHCL